MQLLQSEGNVISLSSEPLISTPPLAVIRKRGVRMSKLRHPRVRRPLQLLVSYGFTHYEVTEIQCRDACFAKIYRPLYQRWLHPGPTAAAPNVPVNVLCCSPASTTSEIRPEDVRKSLTATLDTPSTSPAVQHVRVGVPGAVLTVINPHAMRLGVVAQRDSTQRPDHGTSPVSSKTSLPCTNAPRPERAAHGLHCGNPL
ncbi:hypothetical protein BD309DRAFT_589761 [Dichomitus squalens]|nr:hypothetical protein BD309DRAFT_589761 [Dichomitus squalens]